jgi:hypothetical protein
VKTSRLAALVAVVALAIGACSGGVPAVDATQTARFLSQPTPTALATEATTASTRPGATPKATAEPKATPKPTAKPKSTSYYKPPGWDGYSDVNCSDFDTHAHAQSFFIGTGGSKTNDPYGLDGNHDGVACQNLP